MSIEEFFVDITGSSAGLVRAAGEGEAAAGSLESRLGNVSGGMGGIGRAAESEIGGKGVKNVSLLDKAFGKVGSSIKGALGGMLSMVGQTAGIGALFGGAAGLAEGVKLAQQYNEQMALIAQAYRNMGAAVPTQQIGAMQEKMTALGFAEDQSNAALLKLAQAHIPVAEQMDAMAVAADLARAKNLDLGTSMDLLLKATQGQGRGLQDLGIILPTIVPKMAALNSATAAAAKAHEAYQLALDKYGQGSAKTIAAYDKFSTATLKVTTDTKEMNNQFANLPQVLAQVEKHVGGSAPQWVAANPFSVMGTDMQKIARVAGQELLPGLDDIAKWVSGHESQIESFAVNAVGALGTAAKDAGGFIANDLYPPVKDVVGFLVDHKGVVEGVAATIAGIWAVNKTASAANWAKDALSHLGSVKSFISTQLFPDVAKLFGAGSASTSSGGVAGAAESAAGVRVFVTNWEMMAGGGAGGTAATAAEGAAGGGLLSDLGSMIAPAAIVATVAAAGSWVVNKMGGDFGKSTSMLDFLPIIGPEILNLQRAQQAHIDAEKAATLATKAATDKANRAADTAQQDMRDYHSAMTAEIIATRNATADALVAAGLIQGIIADARSVGTSLAYNQTGSIIKQALAGGNGINTASVAPNGGGGTPQFGDIYINVPGARSPQATATAIRNELLILSRSGSIPSIFGGR